MSRRPAEPVPPRAAPGSRRPAAPGRTPEGELMYVRCAWCGRWTDAVPGPVNGVSHGICAACAHRMEAAPGEGWRGPR
jgi:hypothetical protein